MAKVVRQFFCIKEQKTYRKGDEYTGTRKDLSHVLEEEVEDKQLRIVTEDKAVPKRTKKRPARRRKTKK